MSITLTNDMFSKLSANARDEIVRVFMGNTDCLKKDNSQVVNEVTAFESAALTFGPPLVLPDYNKRSSNDSEKKIRIATKFPVAKATDLYRLAPLADIGRACKEMDSGLFVSNIKSAIWTEGGSFNHRDWDVKRVVMEIKYLQPATSQQIDNSLPTMDRYRVSSILRELRKQGMVIVD